MADNRKMTVFDDGPIEVYGPCTFVEENGKVIRVVDEGEPVYICRCGGSTDKPFCDGSHSKLGFKGAMAAVKASGK